MILAAVVLVVFALVCFLVAAVGQPPSKVALEPLGLFLGGLALLLLLLPRLSTT